MQGHGMAVDWWAFGVLLYEMMAGFPPFYDEEVTNTYKKILHGRFSFPSHFSVSARDLIRKLLQVPNASGVQCLACMALQGFRVSQVHAILFCSCGIHLV